MEFKIGDRVVHPVHGVGIVKTLTEQQFGRAPLRRYYEVTTQGPTLWVPIDVQGQTVLRGVASKASLDECRDLLLAEPLRFDTSPKVRHGEIAARLKGGSLPALCEMVRDLRARNWGIALSPAEEDVLRKTFNTMRDEWAVSDGVSPANALHEIEDLLKEGSLSWIPRAGARRQSGIEFAGW